MNKIEATDKITKALDMYSELNSNNQNMAYIVIQSILASQKNTEASMKKAQENK